MSLLIGIFHFINFRQLLVDVGLISVDGFFPDGRGGVVDDKRSIAVISE